MANISRQNLPYYMNLIFAPQLHILSPRFRQRGSLKELTPIWGLPTRAYQRKALSKKIKLLRFFCFRIK